MATESLKQYAKVENLGKLKQSSLGFINEFKAFAMKGNVVDMAVGIIIGAAFGKIVSSFVADVIMPPLGLLLGGVSFSDLAVTLKEATETAPAVVLKYGAFIQTVVDFTIVAAAVFMVIKAMSRLKRKEEAKPAPVAEIPAEQKLLAEIRDLLAAQKKG
jgi:large conductance mechanosensitive channel